MYVKLPPQKNALAWCSEREQKWLGLGREGGESCSANAMVTRGLTVRRGLAGGKVREGDFRKGAASAKALLLEESRGALV